LDLIAIGNNFMNQIPTAQKLRERIHKWDCVKLKGLYTAKEMVTRLKRQYMEWEKNLCQLHFRQWINN
jgi:hypothetical protein